MAEQRGAAAEWRWAAAVAVVALCAHGGALRAALLYDDEALLVGNPFFTQLGSARHLFDAGYFGSGELSWRPVSTLSHLIEVASFGVSAVAMHAVSVGLHALNAVLCRAWLRRGGLPVAAAGLGALAFAAHPALVEPTLLVSFREDLLVTLFLLLGAHVVAGTPADGPVGWGRAVALAACAAGAMGAKESGVVFPACFAVTAWLQAPPRPWRAWWRAAVVAAPVCLGYVLLRFWVLRNPAEAEVAHLPGGVLGLVAADGWILAQYARLAVWPATLLLDRGVPDPVPWAGALVGWGGALGAGVAAWRLRDRAPAVTAGVAWVAATLLPVMNLVPLSVPLADRFCYLPAVGVALVLGAAVRPWLATPGRSAQLTWAVAVTAVVAGVIRAQVRAADFADNATLWQATVAANPRSARALSNLGRAIGRRGLAHAARDEIEDALEDYDRAIALHRRANDIDSRERNYRCNEAAVLEWRGDLRARTGDPVGAHADWTAARVPLQSVLGEEPGRWQAWRQLASLADKLEDRAAADQALDRAVAALQAAAELRPSAWPTWLQLAELHAYRGATAAELTALRRAVDAARERAEPRLALARRLLELHRGAEAEGLLAAGPRALEALPAYHACLALAQLDAGNMEGALATVRAAVARWPQDPDLRAALARFGQGMGR